VRWQACQGGYLRGSKARRGLRLLVDLATLFAHRGGGRRCTAGLVLPQARQQLLQPSLDVLGQMSYTPDQQPTAWHCARPPSLWGAAAFWCAPSQGTWEVHRDGSGRTSRLRRTLRLPRVQMRASGLSPSLAPAHPRCSCAGVTTAVHLRQRSPPAATST
jgi:hypothetical protein